MKTLLLLVLAAATTLVAQTPSDMYQLGDRKVRIPAPDGFVEISTTFGDVAARMRATEDPGNDFLVSHAPESFIPKLKVSQNIDLGFYTKVSIAKQARSLDVTPELFAGVVAAAEKNSGAYMDPNGPVIKGAEKNSGKGLSELSGVETTVAITGLKSLGYFEKTDKVFSYLAAANIEVSGRKVSILFSTSFVYVNRRLVFVYVYKIEPKAEDERILRDFTKSWTAKIVASNK
jgi:hypothetical protein